MPYMIETFDKPGLADGRATHRSAHLAYLEQNAPLLIACGAKLHDDGTDLGGGLYLVDLDSRDAARAFIEADPFFKHGLFEKVEITRWRKAWLDGRCHL